MKVHEMKKELEKVAKVLPELRHDLDEVYATEQGKKTKLKQLWKDYEDKYYEIKNSKVYKTLQ